MFGSIGYSELIVLCIVAVVLFGRKLPDVARTVGTSYAQFRRGLADLQSTIELDSTSYSSSDPEFDHGYDNEVEATGPKFIPPKNITTGNQEPSSGDSDDIYPS